LVIRRRGDSHTAIQVPEITTVIGFAPQSLYDEAVAQFQIAIPPAFSFIDDENIPYEDGSPQIMDVAPGSIHKELITLEGFDHHLDGAGDR